MSHYAKYIAEREGYEIIEDERGFATFVVNGEQCYIRDIYVHKDYRHERTAARYADKIAELAKEYGCKYLLGSVWIRAKHPEENVKVLLAYGFKLDYLQGEGIFFRKEII